jgi:hypothetical protein
LQPKHEEEYFDLDTPTGKSSRTNLNMNTNIMTKKRDEKRQK